MINLVKKIALSTLMLTGFAQAGTIYFYDVSSKGGPVIPHQSHKMQEYEDHFINEYFGFNELDSLHVSSSFAQIPFEVEGDQQHNPIIVLLLYTNYLYHKDSTLQINVVDGVYIPINVKYLTILNNHSHSYLRLSGLKKEKYKVDLVYALGDVYSKYRPLDINNKMLLSSNYDGFHESFVYSSDYLDKSKDRGHFGFGDRADSIQTSTNDLIVKAKFNNKSVKMIDTMQTIPVNDDFKPFDHAQSFNESELAKFSKISSSIKIHIDKEQKLSFGFVARKSGVYSLCSNYRYFYTENYNQVNKERTSKCQIVSARKPGIYKVSFDLHDGQTNMKGEEITITAGFYKPQLNAPLVSTLSTAPYCVKSNSFCTNSSL